MTLRRPVPPHIRARQSAASDPRRSAWVSANAGSGKTFVLARRVIRLLLERTPPSRLLCLTFTKAAAANMSARVFDILAKWTRLDDDALFAELETTTGARPAPDDVAYARQLFARTVETPGGLKIQTIHAFCERLLRVFPFEANVAARFEVVQDLRQANMLQAARDMVLSAAVSGHEGALFESVQVLEDEAGAAGFETILRQCIGQRRRLRDLDLVRHAEDLRRCLGLRAGEDDESVIDSAIVRDGIAPDRWGEIARAIGAEGGTGQRLASAASFELDDPAKCEAYVLVGLKGDLDPRAPSYLSKKVRTAHPTLCDELDAEQGRILALLDRRRAIRTARRTQALFTIGRAVIDRYEAAKARQGLLDFDDLIDKTLALLQRSGAAWVLYKLDAGIDHILVDEAQDTSPEQWEILRRLASDFTAGEGARTQRRTFFAVGDEKQSIYSFQGAAPKKFDAMHRYFERKISEAAGRDEADAELAYVRLPLSFRSVPSILKAVDGVFATKENFDGLSFEEGVVGTAHEAWKVGLPGRIEIWDTIEGRDTPDPTDWLLPVDQPGKHDPPVLLADRIATVVRSWIAPGTPERVHDADDRPRPVRAGDVLILVRTRGPVFEAVIRALKRRGVPVAGADRMVLTDHIAVMDLVAAGRAALLRGDDLSLACALKSPLVGLVDDDLLALAPGRGTRTLADALDADPAYAAAAATLAEWRRLASSLSPFDFYMRLVGAEGRKRFAARLGPEADDAIDEFLRRALDHEREAAPSLPLFLAAMEAAGDLEIKRDMEAVGDSVRVMTVHAAKGLEAKIVVLADTCCLPDTRLDSKIYALHRDGAAEVGPPLFAWSPRKADDPRAVTEAREMLRAESLQEYRRLLYVAMTRAEERLVVAGFETRPRKKDGSPNRPAGCWYDMILSSLEPMLSEAPAPWDPAQAIRVSGERTRPIAVDDMRAAGVLDASPLPHWAFRPAVCERTPEPPMRPSTALAAADGVQPTGSFAWGDPHARSAGRLAHTLLQQLPEVPAARRQAVAARFVGMRAVGLPAHVTADLIASVLAVLETRRVAPLFGPDSRAEVAVAGSLARADGSLLQVNGRIDRLAVTPSCVWIADFKTGAAPAGEPPRAHVEQLALYRALVIPLYPDRHVRAVLVWTQGPHVVELTPADLDEALRRVLKVRRRTDAAGGQISFDLV